MAARAEALDEVGEILAARRAEIEEKMGEKTVYFFNETDFGNVGAVFLAEKLRGNTTVEALWLQNCGRGAVGARVLAKVLGEDNNTLISLNLHGDLSLGDDGAEAMAEMIRKNTTLEFLGLGACAVGDRGARALGEALKDNFTLKILNLNSNDFGDDAARVLAEALRWNESLEVLDLGYCQLTNAGAKDSGTGGRFGRNPGVCGRICENLAAWEESQKTEEKRK